MRKTVEVKAGFEKEFEAYLKEHNIQNESCTLSSGMMFWETQLKSEEELKGIEALPYLYHIEDTPFIYPS